MFGIQILKNKHTTCIVLQNSDNTTSAKIALHEGGRLQELKCNNVFLIKDIPEFEYKNSYASSILFPFANRIKEGKYTFLEKEFQLTKNEQNKNALHGLVYDKKFEISDSEVQENKCSVTLSYSKKEYAQGFPFKYFISLTYTLYKDSLQLKVLIKNIDHTSFPFSLGWHPYFLSTDLATSFLQFKSDKKVIFDKNLITKEIVAHAQEDVFTLKNKQLDDCFFLKDNIVSFSTPDYEVDLTSDAKQNFLQLYTPKDMPIIAIEPMTGVADSFNNKIGLQVLEPQKSYGISWNLTMKTK